MERTVARVAPTIMAAKTEFACWREKLWEVSKMRGMAAKVR